LQQEYRLGRPPQALFGYLDRAIEADPDFAFAYAARGGLHINAANMRSILRIIAPNADPELFDVERQFELAREDALRALEIDPELGFAHSILAKVSRYTGDNDAARESFDRALELGPGDTLTLRDYAVFHIAANRFREGLELLERASQLDPNFVDPLHYAMAGEFDVALPSLLKNSEILRRRNSMQFFRRPDAQPGAGFSAPERRLSEFSPPNHYPLVSRVGEVAQNATEIRSIMSNRVFQQNRPIDVA
jgi:tetratricopeptide (TPR) repeat protein